MMVLFQDRFGIRKAVMLAMFALPVMFTLFAGRQTDISLSQDTGQDRIQLWARGFTMLKRSPIFGIGYGRYADEMGLVAHNSYVHAFTELGLLGGTLFVGAFYYAMSTLHRLGPSQDMIADRELARLRPYLLAIVAAYGAGMLTISRNYIVPTYMVIGLVTIYLRLVAANVPEAIPQFDVRLVQRFAVIGAAFLFAAEAFVRVFLRWD
jgi:O-antigen ligase